MQKRRNKRTNVSNVVAYLGIAVIFVIFVAGIFITRTPPTRRDVTYAETNACNFDSGTKYPLGDTTNSTNKSFDANNTDFYDIQQNYYFITLPSDDLSINSKFFQDSQADGNGYDLYPKLASVVGFIPSKVLNAYHLKHKTKNTTATGDDKPFQNALVEVQTTPNQDIKAPVSGYNILYGFNPPKGQGNGPAGLLMWTNGTSFVFQIGRADNPRNIFVYVFDVCVDKALVATYNAANTAGRNQLPELAAGQVIAKAMGSRVRLGMRDNGVFVEARTPYVWDTNYQKIGSSTYPVTSPSLSTGSANSLIPVGVVKIGWPNPQDPPQTTTGSGGGGGIVVPVVTEPPVTEPPITQPPVTQSPVVQTTTPYHITFTAYPPVNYTNSQSCSLTSPFCVFDQVSQNGKQLQLCRSADVNTCTMTATFSNKMVQADDSILFDFQVDGLATQDDVNNISCYKASGAVFCFK